jgi:hypothetical protein
MVPAADASCCAAASCQTLLGLTLDATCEFSRDQSGSIRPLGHLGNVNMHTRMCRVQQHAASVLVHDRERSRATNYSSTVHMSFKCRFRVCSDVKRGRCPGNELYSAPTSLTVQCRCSQGHEQLTACIGW